MYAAACFIHGVKNQGLMCLWCWCWLCHSVNFIVALQSFKFDGKLKPLLSGKMKQYGFFALCTAVNPANPFTSTPKELLQVYSCKLGMDLRLKKLDNR